MKSRTLTCVIAITVFAAPVALTSVIAQDQPVHHKDRSHYSQTSAVDPLGENWGATAFSCNNSGPCDGYQNIVLGFVWQNGAMTALPTLGGITALAFGINDHGQVVGEAENSIHNPECVPPQALDFEAVIWAPEGESGEINIHQLPPLAGDTDGLAGETNDRGQVIGMSGPCSQSVTHAVLWDHDTVTDMGNLGGNCCNSPVDINSHGQVVGYSSTAGYTTAHAFLWQKGSTMADLGTLSGDFFSFAFGINDQGVIVGGSCSQIFNNCRAVLWQKDVMTDLNTLVSPGSMPLYLVFGNDINSRGEIATYAFNPGNGEFCAALAIPCDEDNADNQACTDDSQGTTAATEQPRVTLPETVRQQLRKRMGFGPVRSVFADPTRQILLGGTS